jgi:hypothetical protein
MCKRYVKMSMLLHTDIVASTAAFSYDLLPSNLYCRFANMPCNVTFWFNVSITNGMPYAGNCLVYVYALWQHLLLVRDFMLK